MSRLFHSRLLLFFLVGSTLILTSCEDPKLPLQIKRFDSDLLQTNQANNPLHYQMLDKKYPGFYKGFCADILGIDTSEWRSYFMPSLKGFITYPGIKMLKHEVDSVFPDLAFLESDLGKAMYRFKKEFPNDSVPQFVSYISEFGFAHVTYDNLVGIGLDFYLGPKYPMYKAPSIEFPDFMVSRLCREYMLPNTLKAFAISKFESQLKDRRFLAMMLFEGKIKYFIKSLAPNISDTTLFSYSQSQFQWCKDNEGMIWRHLAANDLLFSVEASRYMRYLNDGPFTIADGVPQESAPAMAIYTGYQIIHSFMEKNDHLSLSELMNLNDWDLILRESGYKPN